MRCLHLSACLLVLPLLTGCGDDETHGPLPPASCVGELELGDDVGHADPFGAKAAGQARAGRLADASSIPPPAHGRQGYEDGDFVLANEHMAVIIEDGGLSDGYSRFGGEILAIDKVGDDGRPLGLSRYMETLMGIGLELPDPTSVTVLNDGSDGAEAIVRVVGPLKVIPFVDGSLSNLLNSDYDYVVAYDYILRPAAEKLDIRISLVNPDPDTVDFGLNRPGSDELYGFFHSSQNQTVTPELGFRVEGNTDWLGFISGPWNFAWRTTAGQLEPSIEVSGFALVNGPGFEAEGCTITTLDRVEVIAGGPFYDGLRAAVRRVDGEAAWPAISGVVQDADGTPVADAWVHALAADDSYLSRVKTAADGSYTIHTPADANANLVAQKRGYQHSGSSIAAGSSDATLSFEPHALIHVAATTLADGTPLPVRVQVIPSVALPATPDSFGAQDERNGRLYQEFVMSGDITVAVPAGEHRVLVSRGYEWELYDETVVAQAGMTTEVSAVLEHSVDTTDVMCADFHIHSFMSADSSDPIDYKVRGAIADGLDIPVSSEHDWVVDFGPVVEDLGMTDWAFGMASSELTTFSFGHFGVVPMVSKPGDYNNGAVDWIGQTPGELFTKVHALEQQPAIIVNHPRGGIGGYFAAALVDKDGVPANTELWSDEFDAIEVFNDSDFESNRGDSVNDWFNLLNAGKRVFAVGNSDSHHLRSSPIGYPRSCYFFGHDDPKQLTPGKLRDGILDGNATISGGLFMTVSGPDGERPGATIAAGSGTFTVTVESPSWIDSDNLEVIVSGETVSTEELMPPLGSGVSNRYVNQVQLDLVAGDWVVFHAKGVGDLAPLHPGKNSFAVSNPIFVQ